MSISRASFLRGLAASAALPIVARAADAAVPDSGFVPDSPLDGAQPWTATPRSGTGPLRFAVIGDNTGISRPGVFHQAMKQIGWLQPDFILSVGDLIEGYSDDKAAIAAQWDAVEKSIALAGVPFIYTQGNHDVDNEATHELWSQKRGPAYYAFTYKRALFLILNTEDPPTPMDDKTAKQFYWMVDLMSKDPERAEKLIVDHLNHNSGPTASAGTDYGKLEVANISDRQLAFIRDSLARHPAPAWTFVVLHKPAWKMASPAFAKIQAMLGQRPYTVFAGHTHYFTHDVLDGHDLINMATTGGIRQKDGPGTMDHTMLVTMGPNGPFYANTRLSGLMDVAGDTGQTRVY
jgi:3',5'-cyclic AMP phosphodiesterase CpdA